MGIVLVQMKALLLGTVVGDQVNSVGDVNSNCIVHVDPDNKRENGRYSDPLVTEDVARKLEAAEFAERVGEVDFVPGVPLSSGVSADAAAERVKAVSEIDADVAGSVSGLDTHNSVNFVDGDKMRGGVQATDPVEDVEGDDADAAPAPLTAAQKKAAAAG